MGLLDWFNKINGRPYIWGSAGGRTDFTDAPPGFDCSGFVAWAFYKASGGAIKLPAYTDSIATAPGVTRLAAGQAPQPGDIVLYKFHDPDQPNAVYPHVAIYAGGGMVIQSGGVASRANIGPVGQLPGATYFRVQGAPPYSGGTATVTDPGAPPVIAPPATTGGGSPATAGGTSSGGSGSPAPAQEHGGAPVAEGARWDLWTNGTEGVDWVRFKIQSPMPGGGDWINVRIPTPVGIAHAIGWGLHDAVAGWLPRSPGVQNDSLGVPLAFYLLGGLAVTIGAIAIGFQAVDAAASTPVARVAAIAAA